MHGKIPRRAANPWIRRRVHDVFDNYGEFIARAISGGNLNAPWGIVMAPASFGAFGGDLLVGNFGDGMINAFDATSFAYKGRLQDATGNPRGSVIDINAAKIELACGLLFATSIALSTVHPWGNWRSDVQPKAQILQSSNIPEDVRRLLEKKCGNCHSEKTHYPVYTRFAPVSWMVQHDVREGRDALEMSRWKYYTADNRVDLLTRIGAESRTGEMPLRQYLILHPEDRLTTQEQQHIHEWAKADRRRIRQQLSENSEKPELNSRIEIP